MKRVFLIVLDSVGIGEEPDAAEYGDEGSNTIYAASTSKYFDMSHIARAGYFNIDGIKTAKPYSVSNPTGAFARMREKSKGKDTTTGHWEIAGLISEKAMPTFPDGFPKELLDRLSDKTGRQILCNKPYSGTEVIKDYGKEAIEKGALIVYTSADSVLQIAAHESYIPYKELYHYCEIARDICRGDWGVGRIIARPFEGEWPYKRTVRRHDYTLVPPKKTMLNYISEAGLDVLSVGKIVDIFAESGITDYVRTTSNEDGIEKTISWMDRDFHGICFTNLVDYDMLYGHRNDIDGYAKALTAFDKRWDDLVSGLRDEDLLMITADHGCDPSTPSTDHSREYVPWLIVGKDVKQGTNMGTKETFADIGATIVDYLGIKADIDGNSALHEFVTKD